MTNDSWRVDETYIKVKGKWKYLYRAVDSNVETIDFMFSAKRDKVAAKRFFIKILKAKHSKHQRVINVDHNPANPPAIEELKESGLLSSDCELRQNKYLNNIIEKDHRLAKKLSKYKSYFQYFHTARRTLRGYEIMNAIRKEQVININKGDVLGQKDFIYSLFGIAV